MHQDSEGGGGDLYKKIRLFHAALFHAQIKQRDASESKVWGKFFLWIKVWAMCRKDSLHIANLTPPTRGFRITPLPSFVSSDANKVPAAPLDTKH